MSEVYNANPTVVSVSKSAKHFSKTSIWMDDIGVPSDAMDDDEVEPIDSEEIFGLSFFGPIRLGNGIITVTLQITSEALWIPSTL